MRGRKFPNIKRYVQSHTDRLYSVHIARDKLFVRQRVVGGGVRTQYVIAPSQPRTSAESFSFIFPQGAFNMALLKHQIQAQQHLNSNLSCTILGKD